MIRAAQLTGILSAVLLAGCAGDSNPNSVVGELASDRIELSAETAEPIVEILVAEGEAVAKGQLLLRQDSARAQARLAEAEAALGQSEARLDELVRGPRREQISAARASVAGAADELKFRQTDYARVQEIHARELASPDVLDRAKAALDAAEANSRVRRAQLQELLSGTTIEELAQAEQAVKQAEARRNLARVDLERHDIVAPADGILDSRLFEVGERPAPGQAMLVMLSGTQPYARVYIPEALRVHVGPGTETMVSVDGLEDLLPGKVRWVASEAAFTPYFALTERDRGRLTYEAKIDLDTGGRRLPDGVPVEAELEIGTATR
ncbi:MAG: HlyD family secretion protein [Woeseiaceae bacterium]|jgi:HlyD family secretion protein